MAQSYIPGGRGGGTGIPTVYRGQHFRSRAENALRAARDLVVGWAMRLEVDGAWCSPLWWLADVLNIALEASLAMHGT